MLIFKRSHSIRCLHAWYLVTYSLSPLLLEVKDSPLPQLVANINNVWIKGLKNLFRSFSLLLWMIKLTSKQIEHKILPMRGSDRGTDRLSKVWPKKNFFKSVRGLKSYIMVKPFNLLILGILSILLMAKHLCLFLPLLSFIIVWWLIWAGIFLQFLLLIFYSYDNLQSKVKD